MKVFEFSKGTLVYGATTDFGRREPPWDCAWFRMDTVKAGEKFFDENPDINIVRVVCFSIDDSWKLLSMRDDEEVVERFDVECDGYFIKGSSPGDWTIILKQPMLKMTLRGRTIRARAAWASETPVAEQIEHLRQRLSETTPKP